MINAPRGTNDILPPASSYWQYIETKAHELFTVYDYQEIRTPIFEYTELFSRGIGEVTDIVEKEMYTFEDKGGRSITLRPEGTASVVRSFLENKIYGQSQPTKYYYMGPMFRYERPQSGRYRQFHQIGIEALGCNDPYLDAEVIALGVNFVQNLGLSDLQVLINSIGCPDCRPDFVEQLQNFVESHREKFCSDCLRRLDKNPLRILDCKNEECQNALKDAPRILEHLCSDCEEHFSLVKENLDLLDIDYIIEPQLVRGLDYYTNTAFEVKFTGLGAQDTIFGGGRYNGLTEEIGQRSIPGIGFALGVERLLLTLEEQDIDLPVDSGLDLFIITIGDRARRKAFTLNNELRNRGVKTDMDYLDRSVSSQMKTADRKEADNTIIIGEEELNKGVVTLHNMESGQEQEVSFENIVDTINDLSSEEVK
ncbi:MAG: histidine--tRNA ligase [Bacillota bacterium]